MPRTIELAEGVLDMPGETCAIILAGGSGSRLSQDSPKQFMKLAGRAVLDHAVSQFDQAKAITEIVLVVPAEMSAEQRLIVEDIVVHAKTPIRTVAGGRTRNESTRNAIDTITNDESLVLIHDAARPLLQADVIERCIEALQFYDAVDVVIECADTIVAIDRNDCIAAIPQRQSLRRGQTPQCFRIGTLREAYRRAALADDLSHSDDCGVVLKYLPQVPIKCVAGAESNLKITNPIDLVTADRLFQLRTTPHRNPPRPPAKPSGRDPRKVMVVFGASSGIGEQVVAQARERGDAVVGYSLSLGAIDVRHADEVDRALRDAYRAFGRIDVVICSAGVLHRGLLREQSVETIRDSLDVNLLGSFVVARQSLAYLRSTQGQLVFFTSSAFTRGRASYAAYSAAKAGVVNMTQALAEEFAPEGVRVNCISPERTATRMRRRAFADENQSGMLSADEVAAVTLSIVDGDLTGQIVDVKAAPTPGFASMERPDHCTEDLWDSNSMAVGGMARA